MSEPPPYLDWEMLVGPAPMVAYNPKAGDLPLPLVLGLLRRPDDELGPALV